MSEPVFHGPNPRRRHPRKHAGLPRDQRLHGRPPTDAPMRTSAGTVLAPDAFGHATGGPSELFSSADLKPAPVSGSAGRGLPKTELDGMEAT